MIKNGANVNQKDRLNLSALSYACMLTYADIAIELIAHGCVCTWSMSLNAYSSLEYLMHKKQYKIVKHLVESGYCLSNEKWLTDSAYQTKKIDKEPLNWLRAQLHRPRSLMCIARASIRKRLGDVCIYEKIEDLNVSTYVKDYLKMKF